MIANYHDHWIFSGSGFLYVRSRWSSSIGFSWRLPFTVMHERINAKHYCAHLVHVSFKMLSKFRVPPLHSPHCTFFFYCINLICSHKTRCQTALEVTLRPLLQNNKLKAWAGLERQSYDTSRMLPGQIVLQIKQWINVKSHLEFLLQKVHRRLGFTTHSAIQGKRGSIQVL